MGIEAPGDDGSIEADAPVPGHPGWRVSARFVPQMGSYVVDRLELSVPEGEVPPGGVTQAVLRRLPLASMKDDLARNLHFADTGELLVERLVSPGAVRAMRRQVATHPRRAGRPDAFYARIAALYVQACQTSRSPVADVAERLDMTAVGVRDALVEARRRDLLISPGKGRRGGELTPKALQALKEDQ